MRRSRSTAARAGATEDNQPTAQFYRLATDDRFPYWLYGAQQDNSDVAIPSAVPGRAIGASDWYPAGGGESGWTQPDPRDPEILWGGSYGGEITRYDRRTKQSRVVTAWPQPIDGQATRDLKYRFNWNAPVLVSKHDPNVVYHAAQKLLRSTDGGTSWQEASPDLTRDEKAKQGYPGGPDHARDHRRRDDRDDLLSGGVAAREGRPLGRDGRRPRLGDPRRDEDVAERDAEGAAGHRADQRTRRLAAREGRTPRRGDRLPAGGSTPVRLPDERLREDVGEGRDRAAGRRRSFASSAKTPSGEGFSSPGRSAGSSFRSTTAGAGSRSSGIFRPSRSPTSRSSGAISSSRRRGERSGSSTT